MNLPDWQHAVLSTESEASSRGSILSPSHSAQEHLDAFEGPEKNLEVDFKPSKAYPRGCRELSREQLQEMLDAAKCQILSHVANDHLDAYVLSESSLFVYAHKLVIKTCGTTTLLRCLPILLQAIAPLGLEVEWIGYSRKNFSFPKSQLFPHTSFQDEVEYLNQLLAFPGSAYLLGPVTGDHWLMYVWDNCDRPMEDSTDRTMHILMQDLDAQVAQIFYQHEPNAKEGERMTTSSGIGELTPTAVIDDCAFEPCGYSMNAIDGDAYHTIHITPESHCSYASWETNLRTGSYQKLMRKVLSIFRPKKFTMTLYADQGGLKALTQDPFEEEIITLEAQEKLGVSVTLVYKRKCKSDTHFEGDYTCFVGNWVLQESSP